MNLFRRKKATLGLDIGSGFIKLLEVDHSSDQPEVTRVEVRPVPPDAIVEGEVMDYGSLVSVLQEMVPGGLPKHSRVHAAVGGHDVIIKPIRMERMSEQDAREVVKWEAEQHVHFDIGSVEIDFQILDPEGSGEQMEILLVAAKRDLLDSRTALLSEAGLPPSVMDVEPFAIHNAFAVNHPEAMTGIAALVNVGHEATNVNILEEGNPVLTRDLPFGTRRIRESIQKQHALSAREADDLLRSTVPSAVLQEAVESAADQVALGVERAAAFLMTRQSGGGLGRVYLSGGGGALLGFADALGKRLGIRVDLVHPFDRIPVRPGAAGEFDLEQGAPMLLLALGLALREG